MIIRVYLNVVVSALEIKRLGSSRLFRISLLLFSASSYLNLGLRKNSFNLRKSRINLSFDCSTTPSGLHMCTASLITLVILPQSSNSLIACDTNDACFFFCTCVIRSKGDGRNRCEWKKIALSDYAQYKRRRSDRTPEIYTLTQTTCRAYAVIIVRTA